ncbi:MAG: hypothetical protein KDK50_01575 [Chlamydiia bacterium]|nr:hypothetical protein [Chlamydiia bacterium]
MLTVLRKYQKVFIVVVGFFIVASFLFFGVSSRIGRMPSKLPDPAVGKAIDGSDIHLLHRDAMMRFISADCLDGHLAQVRQVPNFFNDGVLRRDFLESGLADVMGVRYFEAFKGDIDARHKKAKTYKPYVHPRFAHLSAASIWNQFTPNLPEKIEKLQNMEFGPEVFKALSSVYVSTKGINGELVRQVLQYQQRQFQEAQDPYLAQADLSLFGAHSLEDWFGRVFIEKCSNVIINGARLAEKRGYVVTREEAQADLWNNGFKFMSAKNRGEAVKGSEVAEYLDKQLQYLQMNQEMAVNVWRDVLLFRRLMDETGGTLFVDPLMQRQFDAYANDGVKVKTYRLPEYARAYPAQLALYLEKVGKSSHGLPSAPRPMDEIDGQLIEEIFEVKVASCYKPSLVQKVTLKEMLQYELDADHWGSLVAKCPALGGSVSSREERLMKLDALNPQERGLVDAYAREKIVELHEEWVNEALDEATMTNQVLHVSRSGEREPLEGITHLSAFAQLLKEESPKLKGFTDDQQHFYRIEVTKQSEGPKLLTFEQAVDAGVLDSMLSKKLEQSYKRVREQSPKTFQDEKGAWKKWYDVKDDIAKLAYIDPLKKRLEAYLKEQQALYKTNAPAIEGFGKQWELEVAAHTLKRSQDHHFLSDEMLKKDENSWTGIFESKQGDLLFAHIEGKNDSSMPSSEFVKAAQEVLSHEARVHVFNQLLDQIDNV